MTRFLARPDRLTQCAATPPQPHPHVAHVIGRDSHSSALYGGYAGGLGVAFSGGPGQFLLLLDAGNRYWMGYDSTNTRYRSGYKDDTSLLGTLAYSWPFARGRYVLTPGLRSYIEDVSIRKGASRISFIVGIGRRF